MPTDTTSTAPAAPRADLSKPTAKDLPMRHTQTLHRIAGSCLSRLRRLVGTMGTLACLSLVGLGLSAAPALAEDCPNAALRAENNSTLLPECRAYEMVTPLYKEGFPPSPNGGSYSDDGVFGFESVGSFAGNGAGSPDNVYNATRSAAGWTPTALDPPQSIYYGTGGENGTDGIGMIPYVLSADLRSSLWVMRRIDQPGNGNDFLYLGGLEGAFTPIGEIEGTSVGLGGTTPDLSHIVFVKFVGAPGLEEYIGTGNQGAPLRVSVDNTGAFMPGVVCFNKLSNDGRVVVFGSNCGGVAAIWARVGDSATIAVSGSECTRTSGDPGGACNALAEAYIAGAADDGSRVYFTTSQQLVNGDTNQTNDLYECDIPPGVPAPVGTANPCASLTEVSGNATGANIENVVKVSEDGSRVYFVAQGVLAANLGTNDAAAVAGDHNLYVWEKDAAHPAGQTAFVAKLETNDVFPYSHRVQSTADGRYLIFDTANKLLPSDTDEATDVYRYDADTGILLRLSTDTNGGGGNSPGVEARLAIIAPAWQPHYAMTDDGRTVVFETTEALSLADTDGVADVYEWHEGRVSLISNGGGNALWGTAPWITGSGRDIFFRTTVPLTAGDSGTEEDVYDARVEGGFPVTVVSPCAGEACQGAPALPPQQPGVSASAAFNGPGSPPAVETPLASSKPKPASPAQKLAKTLKACRAKHSKKKRAACEKRARNTYRRAK